MANRPRPLPRSFFRRPTAEVAQDLIGCLLLAQKGKTLVGGRIVETEAYVPQGDPANHAAKGETRRNQAMFGPPGTAYVYRIHQVFCLNVVCEEPGVPGAVLIRALEPTHGLPLMRRRRGTSHLQTLCNGPGRLCQALGISGALNQSDLIKGPIRIYPPRKNAEVVATTRIGLSRAQELPLRFLEAGSPYVSRPPKRSS